VRILHARQRAGLAPRWTVRRTISHILLVSASALTPACVPLSILRRVDARPPAASLSNSLRTANTDGTRSIRTGGCDVQRFRRQTLSVLQLFGGRRAGEGVVVRLLALHAVWRAVASRSHQRQPPLSGLNRRAHADCGTLMMVTGPMGQFEFARVSSLRAAQLMRGCVARVPERHKRTTTAQHEVAGGKINVLPREPVRIVAKR